MTPGPGRSTAERAGALQRQLEEMISVGERLRSGLSSRASDEQLGDHERAWLRRMACAVARSVAILQDLPRVPGLPGGDK